VIINNSETVEIYLKYNIRVDMNLAKWCQWYCVTWMFKL